MKISVIAWRRTSETSEEGKTLLEKAVPKETTRISIRFENVIAEKKLEKVFALLGGEEEIGSTSKLVEEAYQIVKELLGKT